MSYLEYQKMILEKVSFDKTLFEKELSKGLRSVSTPQEEAELKGWAVRHYGLQHSDVLSKFMRPSSI
ncbi:MAG: hypothetical protein EAZ57_03870 [Cytophagales bacterium]|nr:MAG: hypothetical protein EAZ67_04885 [Cytophagales bacterium]TAF61349.1 MAG: hypothetical protein EAZ57_03870 [Cytophagales bacterium]